VPATHLLYRHDDGRWYRAAIVQQVRAGPQRRWRVLVTYRTAPGFSYTRRGVGRLRAATTRATG
jgi:hypothetical protein